MAPKFVTLSCYLDGAIYDGLDGVAYNKSPTKTLKVQCGIRFDELINQIHYATSIDKQRHNIKLIYRYPLVVGKVLKYIPLPVKDNDDIHIMFDVLSRHRELSNFDLYIEVEDIELHPIEMTPRIQESVLIDEERSSGLLSTTRHTNAISEMVQNEDFNIISQIAVVNNEMSSEFDTQNEVDGDDILEGDEAGENVEIDYTVQVPSNFTSIEGLDIVNVDNWTVSDSESKNDFTRELGKSSFKDKEELIRAIKLHCIKTHKQFVVAETCPTIWRIKCRLNSISGCKWQVRACKRKGSEFFEITKYTGPHTCLKNMITQDHPNLDANLIAKETQHLIKEQPSISISALRAEIIKKLGYTPSYKKVWVGRQNAIEQIFGNWEESYIALPRFLSAIQSFNLGTIIEWCVTRPNEMDQMQFRRIFWAFAPSIIGFRHCQPVISIDATHLYGKYKGKMMIAMGVDGNNQIFPLSFAIVENESYSSWHWFLSHVKKHVVKERRGICLISDRHGGILKAVNEIGSVWLEPHGFHRYCLRHFINNFNDKFRNTQLKILAYRAGSQNQVRKLNSIMDEIEKLNPRARQWLEQHPFSKLTLAHDDGKRYGVLTTNLSEIFNSVLKGARFLPITSCVQLTFYKLVHYYNMRRPLEISAQANGDAYTPHIVAKQVASMSKASAHSLRSFNRERERNIRGDNS